MKITRFKKDIFHILFRFTGTRILILITGTICFTIFPQRGSVYQKVSKHSAISINSVWNKFDSHWYQKLAVEGYPHRPFTNNVQETWGYMPFYSLVIGSISQVLHADLFFIGIMISNLCTVAGLYFIYKLAQEKFNTGLETSSLILICAGSFYLSIVYSEGIFILLTALTFFLTHKKNYGWAFIAAGLATVTRIQGCLLFIIPAVELLTYNRRNCYRYIPALLLSFAPMVLFMLYLDKTCGEPLAFLKIQHAWGSADLFPLQGFIGLLKGDRIGSSLVNIFFWIMILAIVLSCYRKLPPAYLLFTVLYFLLSTSNEIVYGTTRYMLGVLPVFFAVSISPIYVRQFFKIVNLLFLVLTICAFVTNTPTFI